MKEKKSKKARYSTTWWLFFSALQIGYECKLSHPFFSTQRNDILINMTVLLSRKLEVGSCVFVSDLFIFGGWGLSSGERGVRGGGRKVVYRGRCFRLTELLQPSPSLLGTVLLQLSTSLEMPWERELFNICPVMGWKKLQRKIIIHRAEVVPRNTCMMISPTIIWWQLAFEYTVKYLLKGLCSLFLGLL